MDGGLIVLEPFSFSIFSSLKKDQEMALFYFYFLLFQRVSLCLASHNRLLLRTLQWWKDVVRHVSIFIDMDDHVAELIVEDFHRAHNVNTGMVAKILAEIHPAGLGKPWILVIVPEAMALHCKCQAQDIVLVLLFLTFELHHGVHQLHVSLRSQSKGSAMDLCAERANHRMSRAPDHVAFRAGHKVGGNVRAGNLHCGDVLLSSHSVFNFFHLQIKEKGGFPFFFFFFLTLYVCM